MKYLIIIMFALNLYQVFRGNIFFNQIKKISAFMIKSGFLEPENRNESITKKISSKIKKLLLLCTILFILEIIILIILLFINYFIKYTIIYILIKILIFLTRVFVGYKDKLFYLFFVMTTLYHIVSSIFYGYILYTFIGGL